MERKQYCDELRIFALLAVVTVHVAAENWYSTDVNGIEWQTFYVYDSLLRWAVPVFIMISGSLFLEKNVPVRKIYSKYIFRMAVAFVFWSLFYGLATADTLENGMIYGFKTHIRAILSGHYHMWFVLMITVMYMCIPLLKKMVSDERTTKYFLVLVFVLSFLIPWSLQIIKDFVVYQSEALTKMVSAAYAKISAMNSSDSLVFSFYFVLGYYLDQKEITGKYRRVIYLIGVAGAAFTIIAGLVVSLRTQQYCESYYSNFSVNVLCESAAIHTLFKYHEFRNERRNRIAVTLSKYGFGAYLIHAFFIEKLDEILHFNTLSFHAFASVPVKAGLVFLLAVCVSAVMNRIPVVKKYIV